MNNEDYENWYKTCIYIEYEMSIADFNYFIKNAKAIKKLYDNLQIYQKRLYKWYVYANINMELKQKEAIWLFLNNNIFYSDLKKYK